MLHLNVGRVYHSDGIGSSPIYERVLTTSTSDLIFCAHSAESQIRFELDAYLKIDEVHDPRAEKLARLNREHGWWDGHDTMRGFRSRGTPGPAFFPDGRVFRNWHSYKESFQCWKDGRRYQAHGRTSVTWTLIN